MFLSVKTLRKKSASTLPLNSTTCHLEAESAVAADSNSPAILNFTPQDQFTEDPQHKPHLKLPSSQEEWEDANYFFSQVVGASGIAGDQEEWEDAN